MGLAEHVANRERDAHMMVRQAQEALAAAEEAQKKAADGRAKRLGMVQSLLDAPGTLRLWLRLLGDVRESITFMAFTFDLEVIVALMANARTRGMRVTGVLNKD